MQLKFTLVSLWRGTYIPHSVIGSNPVPLSLDKHWENVPKLEMESVLSFEWLLFSLQIFQHDNLLSKLTSIWSVVGTWNVCLYYGEQPDLSNLNV